MNGSCRGVTRLRLQQSQAQKSYYVAESVRCPFTSPTTLGLRRGGELDEEGAFLIFKDAEQGRLDLFVGGDIDA